MCAWNDSHDFTGIPLESLSHSIFLSKQEFTSHVCMYNNYSIESLSHSIFLSKQEFTSHVCTGSMYNNYSIESLSHSIFLSK